MTEQEKGEQLALIAERAATAERRGLHHTAKAWRDLYVSVLCFSPDQITFAKSRADKPANPL